MSTSYRLVHGYADHDKEPIAIARTDLLRERMRLSDDLDLAGVCSTRDQGSSLFQRRHDKNTFPSNFVVDQ